MACGAALKQKVGQGPRGPGAPQVEPSSLPIKLTFKGGNEAC
jgi:hypothetical protein